MFTKFFISNKEFYNRLLSSFNLSVVFFNFVVSVVISILYVFITLKLCNMDNVCLNQSKCCMLCHQNASPFHERSALKSTENRRMFKRISFVVLTDVVVWIPLCIAALVIWHVPKPVNQNLGELLGYFIPLTVISLLVVPFNSILNLLVYSLHMWKQFFKNKEQTFSKITCL